MATSELTRLVCRHIATKKIIAREVDRLAWKANILMSGRPLTPMEESVDREIRESNSRAIERLGGKADE